MFLTIDYNSFATQTLLMLSKTLKNATLVVPLPKLLHQPPLTTLEHSVINQDHTEPPFTNKYNKLSENGIYFCRKCGVSLFHSSHKFSCSCGWPAFDDSFPDTLHQETDPDGRRIALSCSNCHGHLGHTFTGEHITEKNIRHCVNSASIHFEPISEATLGGGCFWGIEASLRALPGVLCTEVGYAGGHVARPSYQQVCGGDTGHAEAVRVLYVPAIIPVSSLLDRFLQMHNPAQLGGQGPDIGPQYRSVVFCPAGDRTMRGEVGAALGRLRSRGVDPATSVEEVGEGFFSAEDYHQNYIAKNKLAQCHML
eukprot:gnl/Dysnectes_brevis/208_a238_4624.p1 GENE.gnl/Dysnectes_brevis/208_a238_4624~~gnl/Dysnectes_brevis/208_a238_4624.p1  ORF type:complete len:310 (+),score=54.75 gnl/Dysnectes_brevis/208_a238_4624:185-1114(+)